MKKYIWMFCFSILLVFSGRMIPVWAVETVTVAGGEMMPEQQQAEPQGTDESSSVVTTSISVEYVLPFPGIMPDHPLYMFKQFRDAILEKLITDPIRKAEFYILQADKRLQMGISLFAAGKGDLGQTTIKEAETYMERAVRELSSYKQTGGVIPPYILEKLERATAKHEEVITILLPTVSTDQQKGLTASLALLQQVQGSIASLETQQ